MVVFQAANRASGIWCLSACVREGWGIQRFEGPGFRASKSLEVQGLLALSSVSLSPGFGIKTPEPTLGVFSEFGSFTSWSILATQSAIQL